MCEAHESPPSFSPDKGLAMLATEERQQHAKVAMCTCIDQASLQESFNCLFIGSVTLNDNLEKALVIVLATSLYS